MLHVNFTRKLSDMHSHGPFEKDSSLVMALQELIVFEFDYSVTDLRISLGEIVVYTAWRGMTDITRFTGQADEMQVMVEACHHYQKLKRVETLAEAKATIRGLGQKASIAEYFLLEQRPFFGWHLVRAIFCLIFEIEPDDRLLSISGKNLFEIMALAQSEDVPFYDVVDVLAAVA